MNRRLSLLMLPAFVAGAIFGLGGGIAIGVVPLANPAPVVVHLAPGQAQTITVIADATTSPTGTPTPTPSPTPVPTPSPTPAPTPSPTAFRVVPVSIDPTCGIGVSTALNSWIAAQPDGSTLLFPPDSCYKLTGDAGLNLTDRHSLTLIGTNVTLQLRTTGVSTFSSAFFMLRSTDIIIRGFAVDGGNQFTGTPNSVGSVNERMNAAVIYSGSKRIEFDRVAWDNLRGFGPLISSNEGTAWPEDIWIHDSFIRGGEMGIGVIAVRRLKVERTTINDSVYSAFDFEPDTHSAGPNGEPGAGGGYDQVLLSDNDITRYAWGQVLTSWFVAGVPSAAVMNTAFMRGLTIVGNRIHFGPATADNGNADGLGGMGIRMDGSNRKTDLVIKDNVSDDDDTRSSSRSVMQLANVMNLTVTGNRQPIVNGSKFVGDTGTTGIRIVSGNVVTP